MSLVAAPDVLPSLCARLFCLLQLFLRFDHPDKLDGLIRQRHVAATTLLAAARGFMARKRVPALRAAGTKAQGRRGLDKSRVSAGPSLARPLFSFFPAIAFLPFSSSFSPTSSRQTRSSGCQGCQGCSGRQRLACSGQPRSERCRQYAPTTGTECHRGRWLGRRHTRTST